MSTRHMPPYLICDILMMKKLLMHGDELVVKLRLRGVIKWMMQYCNYHMLDQY